MRKMRLFWGLDQPSTEEERDFAGRFDWGGWPMRPLFVAIVVLAVVLSVWLGAGWLSYAVVAGFVVAMTVLRWRR